MYDQFSKAVLVMHHMLPLCDVQTKGQQQLVDKLQKNVGTAIGTELRDGTQVLNDKNSNLVKAGMCFNVVLGEYWRAAVGRFPRGGEGVQLVLWGW